jgi:hypothetical protein
MQHNSGSTSKLQLWGSWQAHLVVKELPSFWLPYVWKAANQAAVDAPCLLGCCCITITTITTSSSSGNVATPTRANTASATAAAAAAAKAAAAAAAAAQGVPVPLHMLCQQVSQLHEAAALRMEGSGLLQHTKTTTATEMPHGHACIGCYQREHGDFAWEPASRGTGTLH